MRAKAVNCRLLAVGKNQNTNAQRPKTILLALLFVIFGLSIARADIVLVPDFRVDQDPTPNSLFRGGIASSIPHGYFVVSYRYTANNYTLMAKRFDLSGNPIGNAFRINQTPSSASTYGFGADVTIDTNGNMIFAWQDGRTGSGHAYFRRFDINANPLISDTVVDQGPSGAAEPQVEALPGGGFVVAFSDGRGLVSVYARIYDSSGNPIGSDFRVDQNPDVDANFGQSYAPLVATSPTGRIYFAWLDARDWGSTIYVNSIYARIFDNSGNPVGSDFLVYKPAIWTNMVVLNSIAAAPDGNFLIGWYDYREDILNMLYPDVFARAFDSNGTPFGSDFKANTTSSAAGGDIACAPSGRCLIIVGEGAHAQGRHMTSTGSFLDTEYQIENGSPSGGVDISPAGSYSFLTSWDDNRSGSDQIWANITGPDFPIPMLSPLVMVFLALALLCAIILLSARLRNKTFPMISFLLIILLSSHANGKDLWVCDTNETTNPCGCNDSLPPIPASLVNPEWTLTLMRGDALKANSRVNVFFVAEGWAAGADQANFNEQAEAFMESLKLNPTYAAYFDYFNFWRVNIISPESGGDVLPMPGVPQAKGASHWIISDDENGAAFFTTGDLNFFSSPQAMQIFNLDSELEAIP